MKKIAFFLSFLLLISAFGCGNDEPDIPRDRDIEIHPFQLFHIAGPNPTTSLQKCDIIVHRKASTADLNLNLPFNGTQVESFAIRELPLTYDSDKNHYTSRTASTSNSRITNVILLIDCNDYIAEMSFVVDGTIQVMGTSNELFYDNVSTTMLFNDNTSYTASYGNFLFALHPDGNSANLNIGNLLHKKDLINYTSISLQGLSLTVTDNGYRITGEKVETNKGEYGRYDYSTGSPTTPLGDSLYLRFENIDAKLNIIDNSMTSSWTMVRLKRVTDTIQKTPEVVTQQRVIEVNRTQMQSKGTLYH